MSIKGRQDVISNFLCIAGQKIYTEWKKRIIEKVFLYDPAFSVTC